jgi:hypothetical protein
MARVLHVASIATSSVGARLSANSRTPSGVAGTRPTWRTTPSSQTATCANSRCTQRIRASRTGQLLTRARSPPYMTMTGLPDLRCSPMLLSRTVAPYYQPATDDIEAVGGARQPLPPFHTGYQRDGSAQPPAQKAIETTGHFATEDADRKPIYLAINNAVPAWTRIRNGQQRYWRSKSTSETSNNL